MPDLQICKTIAEAAVATERAAGCPAEVLFAQCALESGWLQHAPGNNCFGIKAAKDAAPEAKQLLATIEWLTPAECSLWLADVPGREAVADGNRDTSLTTTKGGRVRWKVKDWFAVYPTLADCFARRASLFSQGRYAVAFNAFKDDKNLQKLIRGLSLIYATDGSYADKLLAIITEAPVQAALSAARAA